MERSLLRPWTYFPLGLRAYRDTFRFTGRARRLEIGEFYILSMFATLIVKLFSSFGPQIDTGDFRADLLTNKLVYDAIADIAILPFFALMARRIQDFGFPGWAFPPLLLYVLAINNWKTIAIFSDVEAPTWLFELPAIAIVASR